MKWVRMTGIGHENLPSQARCPQDGLEARLDRKKEKRAGCALYADRVPLGRQVESRRTGQGSSIMSTSPPVRQRTPGHHGIAVRLRNQGIVDHAGQGRIWRGKAAAQNHQRILDRLADVIKTVNGLAV